MNTGKIKAMFGLVKKSLYVWVVQYHFVIPPVILKRYIHKFRHEGSNISRYGNRFYNPMVPEEYNTWLSFQTYEEKKPFTDITFIGRAVWTPQDGIISNEPMHVLDLKDVHTEYVCIAEAKVSFYEQFFSYLNECVKYDVLYFDHDTIKDNVRCNPVLKPDYSYNTLRGYNYIGNCWVVKTDLLEQFEGQPWNPYRWLLELSEQNRSFGHVQKILYSDTKEDKDESDTVRQYLRNHDIKADVTVNPDGISHTVMYALKEKPLISILIPTKDGLDVLKTCVDSIFEKTTYENYEIIIADNRSEKEETFAWFDTVQKEHDNVHVIRVDTPFNFSLINNRMAEAAHGDYYVLLNNDTSVVTEDWLEKMLSYAQRDNVGSVGVMLWYPDGTIQHGGVVMGKGGGVAHRYYRCPHDQKGYLYTLEMPNDVICCTAACLMTSRKCWEQMHGLNEELTVQFNDVDYGLRLLKAGYFNVFLPNVELIHYESKSRGIDLDKEAVKRYTSEVEWVQKTYAYEIQHDPFYNDNFDKNYDYQLVVGTGSN